MPTQTPTAKDHDQFFKTLVKSCYLELFQLFFPAIASELALEQATFLDKEYFSDFPTGRRRVMDIVSRVPGREQAPGMRTVLLHTDVQEEDDGRDPIAQRMFLYALALQQRHFPEPVVSVLLQFCDHAEPIGVDEFRYQTLGAGLSLRYHRVALKGLSAEEYLKGESPLGWALAVRMKRGRLRRVEVMLRSLARILRAGLSDIKTALLLDCVKRYCRLSNAEKKEMQEMLQSDEYRDVQEEDLTWSQQLRREGLLEGRKEGIKEGIKEGRKEGIKEMAVSLCEVLGIEVTPPRQALLARLDLDGLTALCLHLKTHRAWPPA